MKRDSPRRLHKHATLHASSSHSFACQEAALVQEVADMTPDLAAQEGEPAFEKHHKRLKTLTVSIKKNLKKRCIFPTKHKSLKKGAGF